MGVSGDDFALAFVFMAPDGDVAVRSGGLLIADGSLLPTNQLRFACI